MVLLHIRAGTGQVRAADNIVQRMPVRQFEIDISVGLQKNGGFSKITRFMGFVPQQLRSHIKGIGMITRDLFGDAFSHFSPQDLRLFFCPPVHPDHGRPEGLAILS